MNMKVSLFTLGMLLSAYLFPCLSLVVWAQDGSTTGSGPSSGSKGSSSSSGRSRVVKEERIEVVAGTVITLSLKFIPSKADVGDTKLLKLEKSRNGSKELKVFPLKPGITNVAIRDLKGKIRKKIKYQITSTDLSFKVAQISELLYNIEGIEIYSVGEKIIIDGELVVPRDLDRIISVTEAFGGGKKANIVNLVQLSKISQHEIAKRIQAEINRQAGGQNVTVRLANDTFFLEGTVDSSADKDRAQTIAETYVPEILSSRAIDEKGVLKQVKRQAIQNLIVINAEVPPPPPKMVRTTFHFMEVTKNYAKAVLLKWAPSLTSDAGINFGTTDTGEVGANSGGGFTGTINNLIPRLQAGTNGGYARELFSTVSIALDGTPQTVERTESVPFISSVAGGVPVLSKETTAALKISFTPNIQDGDVIQLSDLEFSFNAPTGAGPGGIGTVVSRILSTINVRSGESAVIGGVISNTMAIDIDKDPTAPPEGSSPIFTLLRSRAFVNNKTQFLVFVTPLIISSASKGTADIKRKVIGSRKRKRRQYR